MMTRTGRSFRGRLTDAERDQVLIQMMESLNVLNQRIENIDARVKQIETRTNPTVENLDGESSGANNDANDGNEQLNEEENPRREPLNNGVPWMQQPHMFNVPENFVNRGLYAPCDTAGDITKKVRIDVPDFDGRFNATTFVNWISAIEDIIDRTIVSTRNGGYRKYFVKWKDKPWSDYSWISGDRFNKYHSFNSSEPSFSKPERNDANSKKKVPEH